MDNIDLYESLRGKLKVCYLTGRKDEIVTRCPNCGDSIKNPNKGHLYIQNKSPYKYFCQKCTCKGYVNEKFLKQLEIYDYNLIKNINISYRDYQKKLSIKYGSDYKFFEKKIFFPVDIPENYLFKIEYLEKRLGLELNEEDISKYKIVLSIKRFLEVNKLEILKNTKDEKMKKKLFLFENYCIGFLSMDKTVIIFRSLDENKTGFRYSNLSLFPDIESKKTYAIKNIINTGEDVHNIIITEGIIDILGVYNNIYNKDDSNIYFANNGKSFLVTLNTLKEMGILNANICIYSDADVNINFYKTLIKNNNFLNFNGIKLFYNKIGKDYGVRREQIDLSEEINL